MKHCTQASFVSVLESSALFEREAEIVRGLISQLTIESNGVVDSSRQRENAGALLSQLSAVLLAARLCVFLGCRFHYVGLNGSIVRASTELRCANNSHA